MAEQSTPPGANEMAEVPRLDTGDFYAEWDAEDGVIRLYHGRSADGALANVPADILSPDEVRQLAAWVAEHNLT